MLKSVGFWHMHLKTDVLQIGFLGPEDFGKRLIKSYAALGSRTHSKTSAVQNDYTTDFASNTRGKLCPRSKTLRCCELVPGEGI